MTQKQVLKFMVIAISALLLTSCPWPWENSVMESIYLEDENGTRYYSGSEIYLGNALQNSGQDVIKTFHFINESADIMDFSTEVVFQLIHERYDDFSGSLTVWPTPDNPAATPTDMLDIQTFIQWGENVVPEDSSAKADFIIKNDSSFTGMVTRHYIVEIEIYGKKMGFTFILTGILTPSGPPPMS